MAQMYEKVVSVISKPPNKRTQKEIEALIPWILKKSELMQKLKTDVVIDIIRNCDFVTKQNDDVIIKQGDKGDCFYIILSGIVSIFISNQLADEENLTGTVEEQEAAKAEEDASEKKERKKLDRSKFGNYIAKIPAGKSFGELALISKDCVRNASIIADEETDLLVVNRDLYNRSLKAAQLAEFEEKSTFVAENPLFSNWQAKFKRQMAMSVVKTKIPYDSYIVRQGDPVVGLFFVVSGQAKVVVDPSFHEQQYPHILPLEEDMPVDFEEEKDDFLHVQPRKKRVERDRSPVPLPPDQKGGSTSLPTPRRIESHGKKMKEICLIGARDVIGDIELATELPTYYSSMKCMEDTEVFTLDMKNYERLVTRKNPWSIQAMKEGVGIKLHSRIQRLDRMVPLLNALQRKLDEEKYIKQKQLVAQSAPVGKDKHLHDYNDFIPHRGPLIDLFGPGTVFYRNRMRERAKREAKKHNRGFGGSSVVPSWSLLGMKAAPQQEQLELPKISLDALTSDSSLPQLVQMACLLSDDKDGKLPMRNAFMTEANHVSGGKHGENPEPDWETSDSRLCTLETRIKDWHKLVDQIGPSIVVAVDETDVVALPPSPIRQTTSEKRVVQLSRYKKDEQKKLAPGKKVYVRRRRKERHRSFLSDGEENSREHRHKRRTASEGHASQPSDTDPETDEENRTSIPKISPSPRPRGSKQHLDMLRKHSSNKKQYTPEEYRELKEELRTRTRALQKFLSSLEAF